MSSRSGSGNHQIDISVCLSPSRHSTSRLAKIDLGPSSPSGRAALSSIAVPTRAPWGQCPEVPELARNRQARYPSANGTARAPQVADRHSGLSRLRSEGYLYVDKTALVYKLATEGSVYFLSRPRRFGKSLLLSCIGAYFEGRRELFEGLAIAELDTEWTPYPVLRLDLNAEKYDSVDALRAILNRYLEAWEERFPGGRPERSLAERFLGVIQRAQLQTGKRVVVLVDEYDKPLLSVIGQHELLSDYKLELKAFYGALCGITEQELLANFEPELEELARRSGVSDTECLEQVRRMYDGYKFHPAAPGVYNPFSTLNLLSFMEFQDFWFQTGTPTFLVELLQRADMDPRDLEGTKLEAAEFANYRADPDRPLPVIYQSGYLTIRDYDAEFRLYTLGYPNDEVRRGFLKFRRPR